MGINKTCKCLIDGSMKLHPCSSNCHLFGDCITAFCKANVKPMTNADHIRAMSDEELGEAFANFLRNTLKLNKIKAELEDTFEADMIDWLKQPYKE